MPERPHMTGENQFSPQNPVQMGLSTLRDMRVVRWNRNLHIRQLRIKGYGFPGEWPYRIIPPGIINPGNNILYGIGGGVGRHSQRAADFFRLYRFVWGDVHIPIPPPLGVKRVKSIPLRGEMLSVHDYFTRLVETSPSKEGSYLRHWVDEEADKDYKSYVG